MSDFSYAALDLAQKGWPVFPCQLEDQDGQVVPFDDATAAMHLKKVPIGDLTERGYKDATLNPKKIALWWRVRPDAVIGVALPKGTMALDVDEIAAFDKANLVVPEDAPRQQTIRGGYHVFFRTDGRDVRQTVKEIPGADTRVGGKGYIVAWDPDAFPEIATIPDAPDWVYGASETVLNGGSPTSGATMGIRRVKRGQVEVTSFQVGDRDNALAREAGAMRKRGFGPEEILAVFEIWLRQGRIESPREDPITTKDLQRIAGSIGTRQSDAVDKEHRPEPERYFANTVLKTDHGELTYYVDELVPEGLGLIGGAPKIGKSWLVLQAAMEIADGSGTFLDRAISTPSPVLYYALEDGPRRAKSRMLSLMGFHNLNVDWLEFRFDAPMLGEGLEEDVARWVSDNQGGVVFVDVLARVQPEQKSRGSAYNADYTMLKPMHDVLKSLRKTDRPGGAMPGSVIFVTHLRKQGAEDPYAMLQGTTGVSGSADWSWVIMRKRMDATGTIQMTGRDIEKEPLIEAIFNGAWTATGTTRRGGSKQRNNILDALLTEGDMTTSQIRKYVNEEVLTPDETPLTDNSVNEKLNAMQEGGLVEQTAKYVKGKGGGYVWHAFDESELGQAASAASSAASSAEVASGHGRSLPVRRVRGGAPAGAYSPPPQAPQPPHLPPEPVEPVEGVDGSLPAPGGARTRTRGRLAARRPEPADDGLVDIA